LGSPFSWPLQVVDGVVRRAARSPTRGQRIVFLSDEGRALRWRHLGNRGRKGKRAPERDGASGPPFPSSRVSRGSLKSDFKIVSPFLCFWSRLPTRPAPLPLHMGSRPRPSTLACAHSGCGRRPSSASKRKKTSGPPAGPSPSPTERKFHCPRCPKRFPTSKDLKRHDVVHTGQRAFQVSPARGRRREPRPLEGIPSVISLFPVFLLQSQVWPQRPSRASREKNALGRKGAARSGLSGRSRGERAARDAPANAGRPPATGVPESAPSLPSLPVPASGDSLASTTRPAALEPPRRLYILLF